MARTGSWTMFFLLNLIPVIYSQKCKWLRPQQDYLNEQVLQTFNQMSPLASPPGVCPQSTKELPNIDDLYSISQVEEAAIALREVTSHIIGFYERHHETLQCPEKPWERLQDLLYYLTSLLDDCIPEGAENINFKQQISDYFNLLEKYVKEEDDTCVHNIIELGIKRNLQLAVQLSSRMRRRHLLEIFPTV